MRSIQFLCSITHLSNFFLSEISIFSSTSDCIHIIVFVYVSCFGIFFACLLEIALACYYEFDKVYKPEGLNGINSSHLVDLNTND